MPKTFRGEIDDWHRPKRGQQVYVQRRAVPGPGGRRQVDLAGKPGFGYLAEGDSAGGRFHIGAAALLPFDDGRELPGVSHGGETFLGLRPLRSAITDDVSPCAR